MANNEPQQKKSWPEVAEEHSAKGELNDEIIFYIEDGLQQEPTDDLPQALTEEAPEGAAPPDSRPESEDPRKLLQNATLPLKIKLAMFGNSTCRELLIRDSNKMIQAFVLKNPRLQEREVEQFARNPNISGHVLRRISDNQSWTRSYAVKVALTTNPKTPGDIALKWLRHLNVSELRRLARSKNVQQVVSIMARKKLADIEKH